MSWSTVVLDVDGTLVDTNYHHAVAWFRALRRHDVTVPLWSIHRAIGMGGDRLVAAVAGEAVEERSGDAIRSAWQEEYAPFLTEVCLFDGAVALLDDLRARGCTLVLASSGKPEHVEHYLDLLDGRRFAQAWTTAEDAEASKPAPDLIGRALHQVDADQALVVGDSTWDVLAANELGLPTCCVRTGGFSVDELRAAGAVDVFESLTELRAALDRVLTVPARQDRGS